MDIFEAANNVEFVQSATNTLLAGGYLEDAGDRYCCTPKGGNLLKRILCTPAVTGDEKAMLVFAISHELITKEDIIN